jgi:hypothetical protein
MVVSLAFDNGRDWAKTIGKRWQVEQILGLSDEEISQAIRFVWLATGCGEAPRPAVYESVREAAGTADRRHWMYGGMQALILPNSEQIIHAAGSWARGQQPRPGSRVSVCSSPSSASDRRGCAAARGPTE